MDIDNSLITDSSNTKVKNKANSFTSTFSKTLDSNDSTVEIKDNEATISFKPLKDGKSKVSKKSNAIVKKNKITYMDVFDHADLSYTVGNQQVKEFIILKEKPLSSEQVQYSFEMNIKGLTYEVQKDHTILFNSKKTGQPLYYIEKPFMYDSYKPEGFHSIIEDAIPEGSFSNDIEIKVQEKGNTLVITLIPNRDWLLNENRVYPVTIDPTIKHYQPVFDVDDTNIRSGSPNQTGGADLELGVGLYKNSTQNNVIRSLIKFNMSDIPKGAKVIDAQLNLWLSTTWNNSPINIGLYQATNPWVENEATWNRSNSSTLWANKGGDYNSTLLDSNTISTLGANYDNNHYQWTIDPAIIENMIENPSKNYGFILKSTSEGTATYKKFYSGDYADFASYSPYLTITYYSTSRLGLEDYWSYDQHPIANGIDYVNLSTGNNIIQFFDFSISGRGNSEISFTRTYNSKSAEDSPFGRGWTYEGSATVTENLKDNTMIYTDGDGTSHIFNFDSSTNSYLSPKGKYLTLKKISNGTYEITDKYGNKSHFQQVKKDDPVTSGFYIANLAYEEDLNGNRITYNYDTSGNPTSIIDASGRVLTISYNPAIKRITAIEFEHKKHTFDYDFDGILQESREYIDAVNYVPTTYHYTDGLLSGITDANGQTTTFHYVDGNINSVEQPSLSESIPVTSYSFDIYQHTSTITDPRGNQTNFFMNDNYVVNKVVDSMGNPTVFELDDNYHPVKITDPKGYITTNHYDSKGNLKETIDPKGNTTTFTYDEYSHMLTATDDKGTTTYHYNDQGNLTSEINAIGQETKYGYDDYGNLTSTTFPDGTVENYDYDNLENYIKLITDPLDNTATTIPDSFGNTVNFIDGKDNLTQYGYDYRQLLKTVTDANNEKTSYEYDNNGNIKKITNALGKVTSLEYNGQNLLKRYINPLNQITSMEYDANGNLLKLTKPSGDVTSTEYDSLNRVQSESINGVKQYSYTYDANGNVKTITNESTGESKIFSYDKNNNLTDIIDGTHTIHYGYDSRNQVTSTKTTTGTHSTQLDFTLDSLNRMKNISRNGILLASFGYNLVGLLETTTYQNGITTGATYDSAKRLKTLSIKNGNSSLYSFDYGYDDNGNILTITSNAGNTTYKYDNLNQLKKETLPDGTTISYEYDVVGNRTGKTITQNGVQTTTTVVYNDNNQIESLNGTLFTYDKNGNLTNNNKYTYVYNELDQLVEVKDLTSQTIAKYSYDEEGRRISKTIDGSTTYFHYDGDQVLYETDANNQILAEYTYQENGLPLTMMRNNQTYYYLLNGHGDVIELTDQAGNTVASYTYDAWGNILSQSGEMANQNPYRYAGYRYDGETGLYYLMARYYNSDTRVFLSLDPVMGDSKNPITLNGYLYANNNPVIYSDPQGNMAALAGVYFIPGIGEVALLATGAVVLGGITWKAGSWLGEKARSYLNSQKITKEEADKIAKSKGYKKTKFKSHGEAVYENTKAPRKVRYITRDTDGHIGGAFKGADSVSNLGRKSTRSGTYDKNLNRIGD